MIHLNWHRFSELTTEQLYAILSLRSKVFIVEQNCIYQDLDGKDEDALHLLGMEENVLVAYLRLFLPKHSENKMIFGRVVTEKSARTKGYGKQLIKELLTYCEVYYPGISIQCSAQNYLIQFYEKFGFKISGDIYDEDGIPHIKMQRGV